MKAMSSLSTGQTSELSEEVDVDTEQVDQQREILSDKRPEDIVIVELEGWSKGSSVHYMA